MREYDTGLLVERLPDTRWYVSLYTVAARQSLEVLLARLPEAGASERQLHTAARRAFDSLLTVDIDGLRLHSLEGNQEGRNILEGCIQMLADAEGWASRDRALERLQHLLRISQHACLLLGARLPREYALRLHFQAILVGFTDDSEEESRANRILADTVSQAPAEVGRGIEEVNPFIIAQTSATVQDLIDLMPEVRELIQDTMVSAAEHFGQEIPPHTMAGMLLLTRISQDLEGIRVLTQAERPVQALTLAAVVFELSYLIGYFGSDPARAERWLSLREDGRLAHDDGTLPTIKDFVGHTMLNVRPELQGQELRQAVEERYQEYKFLCGFKHGHAGNTRRAASSARHDGGLLFTPEPQQDNLETWLTLVGIWKGMHLALSVGLNAFFEFSHETPALAGHLVQLVNRLRAVDTEQAELERATGMKELFN